MTGKVARAVAERGSITGPEGKRLFVVLHGWNWVLVLEGVWERGAEENTEFWEVKWQEVGDDRVRNNFMIFLLLTK
jgi:hypothetical protein